jgi:hypothetical protein
MPVRAVPGLTGKQWRRHPIIMPRAARFNQNAGMAGPGFPVRIRFSEVVTLDAGGSVASVLMVTVTADRASREPGGRR